MRLDPAKHTWMTSRGAQRIFELLGDGDARFVGGCVRNAIMGESINDIDIATRHAPTEVAKRLKAGGVKTAETGLAHGTLTAVVDGAPFEITTLRKDVSTDGRRATVAFTTDWAEDAMRRDFTFNAVFAEIGGAIHDFTDGVADAQTRTVRFIGKAEDRIREDYLRILRYFRFLAWYGDSAPDAEAMQACAHNSSGIRKLSAERIWAEMKKFLSARDPGPAAMAMLETGVLEAALPEATNVDGLQCMIAAESRHAIPRDPILRMMAMSVRSVDVQTALAKRLKLSKVESQRFLNWAAADSPTHPEMSEKDARAMGYYDGIQTACDRLRVRAAGSHTKAATHYASLADYLERWVMPKLPIGGKDIIAAGIEKGPQVSRVLSALEALWVRSDFKTNAAQLTLALGLMLSRQ